MSPLSPTPIKKICGLILAGGQGSRMDGVDKGLQLYQGKPLIEHVINALAPQTDAIVISANRNIEEYRKFGYEVIQDASLEKTKPAKTHTAQSRYQGPMAGIGAGLTHIENTSDAAAALICSCDTPLLPAFFQQRLIAALEDNKSNIAVVHDGERTQNLHCLILRESWPGLAMAFASGERAMHRWQREQGRIEVNFSDCAEAYRNFNTLCSLSEPS